MATATQVKERPIVLYAREVLGVLDGTITQLWRVVKPQPKAAIGYGGHKNDIKWDVCAGLGVRTDDACARYIRANYPNPFGSPGDRLWVKEDFYYTGDLRDFTDCSWCHAADVQDHRLTGQIMKRGRANQLPRWASRLTLEVADVRVQRVDEISGPWARCATVKLVNESEAPHD